jgi:hypothetical protein
MPEKLVYITPSELSNEIHHKGWLQEYGSYNQIPQPYLKIDDMKFAEIARRGTPDYIDFRMIKVLENEKPRYLPCYIYWYDDNGLMILFDYDAPTMEFYLIGCFHEMKEITKETCDSLNIPHLGSLYHVFICEKCGYMDTMSDDMMKSEEV